MQLRTGLVAGLFVAGVLSVSGAAYATDTGLELPNLDNATAVSGDDLTTDGGLTDPIYNTLPPAATDTIAAMGTGPCGVGLAVLRSQGFDVPEERDIEGWEYDPLEGECKDFRDALEHAVWAGAEPPYLYECKSLFGKNCIAVGHNACDFALVVGSGLVYVCMGGVTPYN